MTINHYDRCWWQSFTKMVKRAFLKNDFKMKVWLYEMYECQMNRRLMLEYYYYKRLDYEELRNKGLISKKLNFCDWLTDNRY